ncbi:MAG: hypothetical protein KJ072_11645 [Verrucomicrobia bacterium]|nr:hypothetical protein [Verrucomicrobiota bacterium]
MSTPNAGIAARDALLLPTPSDDATVRPWTPHIAKVPDGNDAWRLKRIPRYD